jgi:sec-independent protein translocase protein TatA
MFDPSAPHIIILAIVVLLLFGSRRLPGAAQSLGRSMHIFKRSVSGLDEQDTAANPAGQPMASGPFTSPVQPPAPIAAPVHDATAAQLADLQRQVADLQRQNAVSNSGQVSEAQSSQPL